MDPRTKFEAFIERAGTVQSAAALLQTPEVTVYAVRRGERGVGRRLAARWDLLTKGELPASEMIWIAATRRKRKGATA